MWVSSSRLIRHSRRKSRLNISPPSHISGSRLVSEAAFLTHRVRTHEKWKHQSIAGAINHRKHHLGGTPHTGFCISHRWTVTYGTALGPLSFPSLALLSGWEIIIQWPYSTSVPLNGCALSMLHCQGASATWPNCNRLQSALGSDPRLCISAFLPISLSPWQRTCSSKTDGD